MDVVSACPGSGASEIKNKVVWYRNDGTGTSFTPFIVSTKRSAHSVHAADLDNDGAMEIISGGELDGVAYYQMKTII